MAARTGGVLFLADSNLEFELPDLRPRGWLIEKVESIEQAGALLASGRCEIGIAQLSADPHRLSRRMDELCKALDHLPWLALIAPEALESSEIRRCIWESFHSYQTLPPEIEQLVGALDQASAMARLRPPAQPLSSEPHMVGASPEIGAVFHSIRKFAAVDAPVLITGESGTGKELAAIAIHERSRRASAPFVAVNCAALPPTLIQSELFGHERGAFTGAVRRRIGRIETANQGTIFLDEIGDLAADMQANLLRFLQEKTIQRIGSEREIETDVRVIAATNIDLERAVADGRFREDLYFRLNVLRLHMPPLRTRAGDAEILAKFFCERFSREDGGRARAFTQQALEAIASHPWPGNVRELINRVRRALTMCEGRLITPADLGFARAAEDIGCISLDRAIQQAEQEAVRHALQASRHNLSLAARRLGISRPRLYRLMEKIGHELGTNLRAPRVGSAVRPPPLQPQ